MVVLSFIVDMKRETIQLLITALFFAFIAGCGYLQVNPPPDVNIEDQGNAKTNWQAVAANMLATAGYGEGENIQARAGQIFDQINRHFGSKLTGWTDAGLEWWLSSEHNKWPENPYKTINVIGNKQKKEPFANQLLPEILGRQARNGHILAVSLSWPPVTEGNKASGGHVLNYIGDSQKKNKVHDNPDHIRVSDPLRNTGGAIQTYPYDRFDAPNPQGLNSGNGWYIAYDPNHPFIKNVVTLSPVDKPMDVKKASTSLSSYRVKQPDPEDATAFRFICESDSAFLDYEIFMDRETRKDPELFEKISTDSMISVNWPLAGRKSSDGESLTISTELALHAIHKMTHRDIYFKFGKNNLLKAAPDICWQIEFTEIKNVRLANITGGYIVGSIEVIRPDSVIKSNDTFAELRFFTRYDIHESLLYHKLILCGEKGYRTGKVRLGNSFGKPSIEELWNFDNWMTTFNRHEELSDTLVYRLNWEGKILYPEGEDFHKRKSETEN